MADVDYLYSIATDFTSCDAPAVDTLALEIAASAIVTALATDAEGNARITTVGDVCTIWFKAILSSGDETILDGIVADHDGTFQSDPGRPVAIQGEVRGADGTLLTGDRPLTLGQVSFKRTDDGSEGMDVDGTASGTVTNIWDGTGAGDTGASDWTPSGEGSETAGSMHHGTNGWDTGVTSKDSTTLVTNGSDIDVSGYAQLSFWLQPKAFPSGSRLDIRWQTVAGVDRGVQLDVAGYVTDYDLDVWQKVTIPMADFSIGANNVGRIRLTYAKEAGQQFWLDQIEFTASGGDGPYTYRVAAPDAAELYHVSMVVLMLAAPATGWDSDTFANADVLTNGLLLRHRRLSDGEVFWSFNSRDNVDLFGRYHPQDDVEFADGVLLVGFMVKPGGATVVVSDDEVLEYVVRDDLSDLSSARAFVHYGVEEVA
jgi:hypothetical protein